MEIHNYPEVNDSLEKCPFCGHTPMWWLEGSLYKEVGKRVLVVSCPNCGAKQETGVKNLTTEWGMETAIKKWNARVM